MLFIVKVRIAVTKLAELGQKLQSGTLDTSRIQSTYCLDDDPAVGFSLWEADNAGQLEECLAPHRQFYEQVLEIHPVIPAADAQVKLMAALSE